MNRPAATSRADPVPVVELAGYLGSTGLALAADGSPGPACVLVDLDEPVTGAAALVGQLPVAAPVLVGVARQPLSAAARLVRGATRWTAVSGPTTSLPCGGTPSIVLPGEPYPKRRRRPGDGPGLAGRAGRRPGPDLVWVSLVTARALLTAQMETGPVGAALIPG